MFYPSLFESVSTLKVIRLEIGALAAWTPSKEVEIESYAASCYASVFEYPKTSVLTVLPERTFWEKATILHHEANRPQSSDMPMRYSRHYYDLFRMANSNVKESSFRNLALLSRVVEFKMKFYPRGWADYPNAKPDTLKPVPPEYRITQLEEDYTKMRDMLYGNIPPYSAKFSADICFKAF